MKITMHITTRIKRAIAGVATVAVLALSFYGGRVYQNNIDQPLATQYSPATTTLSTSSRNIGAGGSATAVLSGAAAAATTPSSH